ncbi:MAG: hypothetical protein ACK57U_19065, partial [Planctomycetota bacterium]
PPAGDDVMHSPYTPLGTPLPSPWDPPPMPADDEASAVEAIAPLEKVLELAPERIDTRTSLVDAYRKVGMEDMAKLQEEKLAALKKEQAEKAAAPKKDD